MDIKLLKQIVNTAYLSPCCRDKFSSFELEEEIFMSLGALSTIKDGRKREKRRMELSVKLQFFCYDFCYLLL